MSPFKSQAQRRKFGELVKEGKVSKETFKEWSDATGKGPLPERVTPKKTAPSKFATRPKRGGK